MELHIIIIITVTLTIKSRNQRSLPWIEDLKHIHKNSTIMLAFRYMLASMCSNFRNIFGCSLLCVAGNTNVTFYTGKGKSYPCNKPWRPIWLWDTEAPTFSRRVAVRLSDLCASRLPFNPRKIPGTHFCWRLSWPQGHSAAGRIRSIEKSNDLIENWTHSLPPCSIVPHRFENFKFWLIRHVMKLNSDVNSGLC
jgi:hypothetical protein